MNITNTLLFFVDKSAMQRILTFYQYKITVYLLMIVEVLTVEVFNNWPLAFLSLLGMIKLDHQTNSGVSYALYLTFKVILKDLCCSKPQDTHEWTYGSKAENNFGMNGPYM